ncbi:hypothetical protein V8G54_003996 [Vigna mungo]|uniref:PGG domain-containing protein n=1 Tax=Vigna mungo TaxID=3915 RepID=A0AAQ3PD15_VIGMU
MLKEAQTWVKERAQSCSTIVAILIATVAFSAAYPTEGGREYGTDSFPIKEFLFFTILDVVALTTSLASVSIFLFIIISSYTLWDFHKYLPRVLKCGFIMLFLSLITTVVAFCETFWLTNRYVRMGNRPT